MYEGGEGVGSGGEKEKRRCAEEDEEIEEDGSVYCRKEEEVNGEVECSMKEEKAGEIYIETHEQTLPKNITTFPSSLAKVK